MEPTRQVTAYRAIAGNTVLDLEMKNQPIRVQLGGTALAEMTIHDQNVVWKDIFALKNLATWLPVHLESFATRMNCPALLVIATPDITAHRDLHLESKSHVLQVLIVVKEVPFQLHAVQENIFLDNTTRMSQSVYCVKLASTAIEAVSSNLKEIAMPGTSALQDNQRHPLTRTHVQPDIFVKQGHQRLQDVQMVLTNSPNTSQSATSVQKVTFVIIQQQR